MARAAAPVAGPVLIVIASLIVVRHYAFEPRMASHDMSDYWLPLHCFMGTTLRSGHIPGWNPFAMSGMPFAPDPQAGWMSLPAMALFTALPCGVAIRWLMIGLSVSTGLAMYWFLRGEGASRLAATVGGLVLGLAIASSVTATTFRFPGAITFTLLTLGATGRFVRASQMSRRLLWLAVAAICFGQLAAAYLGMGLFVGTATLFAYLSVTLIPWVRTKRWSIRRAVVSLSAMAAAFFLVNLAYLLPRLAYASRVSLSLGYGQLNHISRQYLGHAQSFPGSGTALTWPLNFSLVSGRYLGGVLLLVFAGFWSARKRLVWAFAAIGLLSYLASLQVVVNHFPKALSGIGIVDQYLFRPYRLTFGVFIPIAVLAALGVEAWLQARSHRTRLLMLAPGILAWIVLPLVQGAPPGRLVFLTLGAGAAIAALTVARRIPTVALAVAPILAIEIVASTFLVRPRLTFEPASSLLHPLPYPQILTATYLTPTPLARALQAGGDGRYLTLGRSKDFRALATNQGMLYGIESTQGYLSIQLLRYWLFVRALSHTSQGRQYAFFKAPPPVVLDLLQVDWIVASAQNLGAVEPDATLVAQDGGWSLFRRGVTVPRASALFDWTVLGSRDQALGEVATDGFDFAHKAVLEADPGITPSGASSQGGTVAYAQRGSQAARVEVDVPAAAIILIRNVFDPNWHADVDGQSAPLLAVDSVVQGVAVPAGHHMIELKYDDPTVGLGLLGSGSSLLVLGGLALIFLRRERRTKGEPDGVARPPISPDATLTDEGLAGSTC